MTSVTKGVAAVLIIGAALFGLLSCGTGAPQNGGGQPAGSTPPQAAPPSKASPSITPIAPNANQLPVKSSPATGETIPWKLVKVDEEKNRIYLSAGQVGCDVPSVVHLQETPSEIIIAVSSMQSPADGPCTGQKVSLVGYVQLSEPVAGRRIVGNTG
jgi:hypothetical protein